MCDAVALENEYAEVDDKAFVDHEIDMRKDKVYYRRNRVVLPPLKDSEDNVKFPLERKYPKEDGKTFIDHESEIQKNEDRNKEILLQLRDDAEKLPLDMKYPEECDKTFIIVKKIEIQESEYYYHNILPQLRDDYYHDNEKVPEAYQHYRRVRVVMPPLSDDDDDNEKFSLERKHAEEDDKTFDEMRDNENLYKVLLQRLKNDYDFDDCDEKVPLGRKYPEEYDKTFIDHEIEIQKNEDRYKDILPRLRDDDDEMVTLERKCPEEDDKIIINHEIDMQKNENHYITILLPLSDENFPEDFQYMEDVTVINMRIRRFSTCNLESVKYFEEFVEISKCLNSLLPPVSHQSLFWIDMWLYGEWIEQDHKSVVGVEFLHRNINFEPYIDYYSASFRKGVRNIYMDTALMQLMEHMPMLCQKWPCQYLLKSLDVYGTCVAVKILVSAALNKKFRFNAHKRFYEIWLYMEYLSEISGHNLLKWSEPSYFICRHAAMFMALTDSNITVYGFDFIKTSIVKMISERWFPANRHIVSLIGTFMNLKSCERDQLPSYLFKLLEGTDESVQNALEQIHHHHDANKPNTLPQKLMRIIFDHIITNTVCLGEKLLKVEEKMKFIEAVYRYKIRPYFPINNECKCRAFNKNKFEKIGEIWCHQEYGLDMKFNEFFVYDEFMRNLHCISIFHELFMELERRFEIKFPQSFVYSNFWEMVTTFGLVPWYVKMIIMKCPFLLESSENKFIHMSFDDLTDEEKEFIDYQNWTDKVFTFDSKSYINQRFPKSLPVLLPAPKNYDVSGKTFSECLEEIEEWKKRREEK